MKTGKVSGLSEAGWVTIASWDGTCLGRERAGPAVAHLAGSPAAFPGGITGC